jgi:hypothetical protein
MQNICQLRLKIDVTHFSTLTRLCHRKSSNSMDPLKTAEGTGGSPTCFFKERRAIERYPVQKILSYQSIMSDNLTQC